MSTHQYNPTDMLASRPVRVAIMIAALVALTAGYRWWNGPERYINRMLSEAASALSHDGAETDLRALAAVASLQDHLHPDVPSTSAVAHCCVGDRKRSQRQRAFAQRH